MRRVRHRQAEETSLYQRVANLPLKVEGYRLEPLAQEIGDGWIRRTTVVVLRGLAHEGVGEDVTYQEADQLAFQTDPRTVPLAGDYSLDGFSHHLDRLDLFPRPPVESAARPYRRWALESAALDLALSQQGCQLSEVLEHEVQPLHFVASLGLGQPPSMEPLHRLLRLNPDLEFKVDYDERWTPELIEALSKLDGIRTVDLKGQYRGAFRGPDADPDRYRQVADLLPKAWIEDPEWSPAIEQALRPHLSRVTWDAPIHSLADIEQRPFPPRCLNIKPSRFGYLFELLRVYEYCHARAIEMYGGGQFELGPGRGQAQYLASLFHAAAPNDLAPSVYNDPDRPSDLPRSPLILDPSKVGFRAASM